MIQISLDFVSFGWLIIFKISYFPLFPIFTNKTVNFQKAFNKGNYRPFQAFEKSFIL